MTEPEIVLADPPRRYTGRSNVEKYDKIVAFLQQWPGEWARVASEPLRKDAERIAVSLRNRKCKTALRKTDTGTDVYAKYLP